MAAQKKSTGKTAQQKKQTGGQRTGQRSSSARGTRSHTPARKRAARPNTLGRQITALCVIAVGALAFFSLIFGNTGAVGAAIKQVLLGIFGGGAYLFPVVMVYTGVLMSLFSDRPGTTAKVWTAYGLQIVVSAFVHIFAAPVEYQNFFQIVADLYQSGQKVASGGVLGGLLTVGCLKLFGIAGTVIVLLLLAVICFVVVSGITLDQIASLLFPRREQLEEDDGYAEEDERAVAAAAAPAAERKRFNIDLPLDEKKPRREKRESAEETQRPAKGQEKTAPREAEPVRIPAPPEVSAALDSPVEIDTGTGELFPDDLFEKAVAVGEKPVVVTKEEIRAEEKKVEAELAKAEAADKREYVYPPTELLKRDTSGGAADTADELRQNAAKIVDTLSSFGVETKIIHVARGPAVTRYELQPSVGVKISRITALADDISLALASVGVRIEAPIPGKAAVGIEVPNKNTSTIYIRDILESDNFKGAKSKLAFALGKDLGGVSMVGDIAKMPHMLVAGATGSGKSVCINSIVTSILYKATPEEVRLIMVDPKVVELAVYNGIPHLLIPVVTEPKKAAGALNWAVGEMERRYHLFAEKNVRYNQLAVGDEEIVAMPHIVIIIDELADLMMTSPKEVEDAIMRLAQKARAAGMHLIIATQRPSVDVITGTIKANVPSRIAFAVSSSVDSRTILDMGGAEKLLGKGDMLYYPVGAAKPIRVQGCFVSDAEVETVVEFVKKNAEADYDDKIIESIDNAAAKGDKAAGGGEDDSDEMLPAAIEVVVESGMASTSMLQRRLKLGYARASRLIDEMEARGIVGPFEGSKPRTVKLSKTEWQEMQMRERDDAEARGE